MKTNDENIIHLWLKVCWDIFPIINNLKHYFDDKFQRSKNVNILEKLKAVASEANWKKKGLDLPKSLTSRKKVMIKSVFAKKK